MEPLRNVLIAQRSTMGVGGACDAYVLAREDAELTEALAWADRRRIAVHVLGGGSNLVVADGGVRGLTLHVALRGVTWRDDGDGVVVNARAGEPWDDLVAAATARDLGGVECLSGIPGLVGATPIQNVGAYGQEVSQTLLRLRAFDRVARRVVELSPDACRFSYRDSLFKSIEPERYVVLDVSLRLRRGAAPPAHAELARHLESRGLERPSATQIRESVLAVRAEKSMVLNPEDENFRSCGSFFTNPIVRSTELADVEMLAQDPAMPRYPLADGRVKLAAGWLIEHAALPRGTRQGAVGLSTKHALSIVAHEGATARDVVAFAWRVRRAVHERFGVTLVPEPCFWGFGELDDGLPIEPD